MISEQLKDVYKVAPEEKEPVDQQDQTDLITWRHWPAAFHCLMAFISIRGGPEVPRVSHKHKALRRAVLFAIFYGFPLHSLLITGAIKVNYLIKLTPTLKYRILNKLQNKKKIATLT